MKLVNRAALTMLFALFVVGAYIACGGGARDLVQPTAVKPLAELEPVAPSMVESNTCRGYDLKKYTHFRNDGVTVTVTITNPYDHGCGDVAAAVYHQIKSVSNQVMFGSYKTRNLGAKETAVMIFPIPCDPWQADAVMGNWMPKTPIFSPGYFLGYDVGDGYGCSKPNPRPTPKPTPTPTPSPEPTPTPEVKPCYYEVSCGQHQHTGNSCPDSSKEYICETVGGSWSNWFGQQNHCRLALPGISRDDFQLTPGQSDKACLNKRD